MLHLQNKPPTLPPELCALLPRELLDAVLTSGAPTVEELRLHAERRATVTSGGRSYPTRISLSGEALRHLLTTLAGGSLYAYTQSIAEGYLSLPCGVRIGVSGQAALEGERVIGVSRVTGLILRIPHELPVSATALLTLLKESDSSRGILLYAPPGGGKTTMLRAAAREAASPLNAYRTVVVDSRGELFDTLHGADLSLDVLVGYPRRLGINIAVRSLGASLILCDEIGDATDADAILQAAGCGVPIIATAHAANRKELLTRPTVKHLLESGVFSYTVGLVRESGGFQLQTHKEDFPC